MAQELLDHDRIRRNFERVDPMRLDPGPDRLRAVRAPLDPFAVAEPLLQRLCAEIDAQFPEQRVLLAPFVDRVVVRLARMQAATEPDPKAALELRTAFVAALNDLEDLCEALLHIKR